MTVTARSRSASPSASVSASQAPPSPKRARLSTASPEPAAVQRKSYSHVPAYGQGLHLAPMVRCGTLPTRLLSLQYGANLVWGPEIVDRAMMGCQRSVDPLTGIVKFHKEDGKSIFDTHAVEKHRVIFQVGSADPAQAVEAAKLVQHDVAGVDLNCGCPKPFSTTGAMGAMLLYAPDTLCAILRALVSVLDIPVSCKIRLLPTQEDTITLVKRIAQTGISNLTVHCRTKDMRPREPALTDRLSDIVNVMKETGIPVVANGDCLGYLDADRVRQLTGVSACMVARAAEANPSCFSPDGLRDPVTQLVPEYLRIAAAINNPWGNSKYCLNAMDFAASPHKGQAGAPKRRKQLKQELSQAKGYEGLVDTLKLDLLDEEQRKDWVDHLLPQLKDLPTVPQDPALDRDNQHQPPL